MPRILSKHADLNAEEEEGLEGWGGVAKKTQEDRVRAMKMFKEKQGGRRNKFRRIMLTFLKPSPSVSGYGGPQQ